MANDSEQRPKVVKTSISIEEDLIEWGRNVPGGLSLMARILLRRVKDGELKIELPAAQVIEEKKPPKSN